jgi:hypothetical protein
MCAHEKITSHTAILFINNSVFISVLQANASPLKPIYDSLPVLFKDHYEGDYFRLTLYLIYEAQKGPESFYAPYLAILENPYSAIQWAPDHRLELHDTLLITEAYNQE